MDVEIMQTFRIPHNFGDLKVFLNNLQAQYQSSIIGISSDKLILIDENRNEKKELLIISVKFSVTGGKINEIKSISKTELKGMKQISIADNLFVTFLCSPEEYEKELEDNLFLL